MILDHEPLTINNFRGLFGRGEFKDSVPEDHFISALNTITIGRELKTRDGFLLGTELADIRRIWEYKRQGEASRVIILNSSGQFFDSAVSLSVPILTVATATDFSAVSQYNRAYITPHNGITGIAGEFVYVYSGSGAARKAAGTAPNSGFTVSVSATAGNIESGTHIFGVCFESDSGFISAPGQLTAIVVDGTKKVELTSIPVGPTGTAARRIVASRSIQQFNGDLDGYELFFLDRLDDNSDTDLTVNFYDADLQVSCDYTFDQLAEIPAVVNITTYGNRLVFISPNTNQSLAFISKIAEPESINELSGFVICDPSEPEGLKNGVEFRDNLYLTKGGKLYATRDNGYDPSTWPAPCIDKGLGADVFTISTIQDNKGANLDFFIIGDQSGLFIFNGTLVRPELSYKILNWWNRINKAYFNKVQIVIDTKQFRIYVAVPLDNATSCSHILVGDYTEGLDAKNIKWHIWASDAFTVECISVSINNSTKKTFLRVGGRAGNLWNQTVGEVNDNSVTAIESYVQFSDMYLEEGKVHHLVGITTRVIGSGSLQYSIRGEDDSNIVNLNSLTLAASPGREYFKHANYNNEKISVKIRTNLAGEYFKLQSITLYLQAVWNTRPS